MRSRLALLAALMILGAVVLVDLATPTASASTCVTIQPDPQFSPIDPCKVVCRAAHLDCIE